MKKVLFLLSFIFIVSCNKDENTEPKPVGQNISVLIQPNQTDATYSSAQESHYVVRNTQTHLNKLLLFIGGSYSAPKDYNFICDHGATIGLDVISLSYPNGVAAFSMSNSSDPNGFNNFREEICFGNQVSSMVDVDVLNCITTRATKLLLYLKNTYPDQNWGQYLTATNAILWNKVIVSGHSQGSGHACYLAKAFLTDRVVMFSGPNDFSTYFNSPANWLSQTGLTPLNKHFSLLHTQDEIVPFAYQVANIKALGLLSATQSPLLVDNLISPYSNARSLSLNIPAISYHSSTVGQNALLPNIWTYMFTAN
ncbi:MAG: hypothetical protein WCJ62_02040 [Flavobacterium sp.]